MKVLRLLICKVKTENETDWHQNFFKINYLCSRGTFFGSRDEREGRQHDVDTLTSRVARWFVFKPKIPIWVNFGGP
jgi:hypothetical protein